MALVTFYQCDERPSQSGSWHRDIPGDGDLDTWPQADVNRAPAWLDLAAPSDSSARDARAATRQARHAMPSAYSSWFPRGGCKASLLLGELPRLNQKKKNLPA